MGIQSKQDTINSSLSKLIANYQIDSYLVYGLNGTRRLHTVVRNTNGTTIHVDDLPLEDRATSDEWDIRDMWVEDDPLAQCQSNVWINTWNRLMQRLRQSGKPGLGG